MTVKFARKHWRDAGRVKTVGQLLCHSCRATARDWQSLLPFVISCKLESIAFRAPAG